MASWHAWLGLLALGGLALLPLAGGGVAGLALLAATVLLAGRFAWMLVVRRRFTVDLLMAVVGAVTLERGLVAEGLVVMALYAAAEAVEEWVERLAARRVEAAARLLPRRVLVERGGSQVEVPVEEVRAGDVVVVRVGEAVPVDGVALDGGVVDASIATGESRPLEVEPGEGVLSGSVVVEGPLRVRATRPPGESFAQRLIAEALEALEEKSGTARLLERLAPPITLAVLAAYAAASQLLGPERALAVLLAGCPSAFIVAAGFQAGYAIASLASRGVLVRGGRALEAASAVDAVVLDKTGTLTRPVARPAGGRWGPAAPLAAALARASRHPVARALQAVNPPVNAVVEEAREIPGRGVAGRVSGVEVEVARAPRGPCPHALLLRAGRHVEVACIDEEPAPGAQALVKALRARGVRVVIASGDSRERVEAIARLLGVEEYHWGMKPQDKARLVEALKAQGHRVAFAGDGVNDAPALARADFSVAVGSVDLAREVADAVAPAGPGQVLEAFKAAWAYKASLAAAFATAAAVKLATAALGLAGHIPLILAALLGDDGSTLAALAAGLLAYKLHGARAPA